LHATTNDGMDEQSLSVPQHEHLEGKFARAIEQHTAKVGLRLFLAPAGVPPDRGEAAPEFRIGRALMLLGKRCAPSVAMRPRFISAILTSAGASTPRSMGLLKKTPLIGTCRDHCRQDRNEESIYASRQSLILPVRVGEPYSHFGNILLELSAVANATCRRNAVYYSGLQNKHC